MRNKILITAIVISLVLHFIFLGGWGIFFRAMPGRFEYIEFLLMHYKKAAAFDVFKGRFENGKVAIPSVAPPQAKEALPPVKKEAIVVPKPRIEVKPVKEAVVEQDAMKEVKWAEVSESRLRTANVVISYKKLLQELIIQYLEYPKDEKEKGIKGEVVVSFVVLRNGSLKEVGVPSEYRSPVESFNNAAIEAVRTASSYFPPFPSDCREQEIRFVVRIHFE